MTAIANCFICSTGFGTYTSREFKIEVYIAKCTAKITDDVIFLVFSQNSIHLATSTQCQKSVLQVGKYVRVCLKFLLLNFLFTHQILCNNKFKYLTSYVESLNAVLEKNTCKKLLKSFYFFIPYSTDLGQTIPHHAVLNLYMVGSILSFFYKTS